MAFTSCEVYTIKKVLLYTGNHIKFMRDVVIPKL